MGSVIRPVFTNGERLTAQRLNEIVEYLRTSLRRALLAPLSPGVAAGLELEGVAAATLSTTPVTGVGSLAAPGKAQALMTVTVRPGVAIDGLARILVSSDEVTFSPQDVVDQIPDLASGDLVLVSLGVSTGAATVDPTCAPAAGTTVFEGARLFFSRIDAPDEARLLSPAASAARPAPSVNPWADPIDQAGSAASYAVPLGSIFYLQGDGTTLTPSLVQRAGVMASLGAVRNSYGDVSVLLDRAPDGTAAVGVAVPTVFWPTAPAFFTTTAGGPLVQSAVLASDVGAAPAARPSRYANYVLEAAGGNSAPGMTALPAGTSGVVAIPMQYDGSHPNSSGFSFIGHAGFPVLLSTTNGLLQPMVTPPANGAPPTETTLPIGLSAAPSYSDANGLLIVPVATAGIVMAYVWATGAVSAGTLLAPSLTPIPPGGGPSGAQWGLIPIGAKAGVGILSVVGQLALSLPAPPSGGAWVPAWVWVNRVF